MDVESAKQIGGRYTNDVCEECKAKLIEQAKKINALSMLNPMGTSKKFMDLLCHKCKKHLIRKLRNGK